MSMSAGILDSEPATSTRGGPRSGLRERLPVMALLVLVAVAAVTAGRGLAQLADRPDVPTMPVSSQVERTWGIRFTSVNVSADGGLVDLRFVVLDPVKAAAAMSERDTVPRLSVEDHGQVVLHPSMTMHRGMNAGRTYFLLYRNTAGLVQVGHSVSVLVGDLRIDGAVPG